MDGFNAVNPQTDLTPSLYPPSSPWGGLQAQAAPGPSFPFGDPMQNFMPPQGYGEIPEEFIDLPEVVPQEFIDAADEYLGSWLRESRAYALEKDYVWSMEKDLWRGERTIQSMELKAANRKVDDRSRKTITQEDEEDISDFVYPVAPAIQSVAQNIFNAIFSGPDAIQVTSDDPVGSQTDGASIATRMTKLFLKMLKEGRFYEQTMRALESWAIYGHVFGKVWWSRKTYTTLQASSITGEISPKEHTIRSCPIIQPLPIHRMLIDWEATNADPFTHRGIGHWVPRTYHEIIQSFSKGAYTLNEDKVRQKWQDSGGGGITTTQDRAVDTEALNRADNKTRILWVWEWHGEIPFQDSLWESVVTYVTEQDAESPESGIMVRASMRPALECGIRPIISAPFIPDPDQCLGLSLHKATADSHFILSRLIGQLLDGIRYQIDQCGFVREGGELHTWLKTNKSIPPGKWFASADPSTESAPMRLGEFQIQALLQAIQEMKQEFEQESGITSTFQGLSTVRKTAAEASILQTQSSQPVNSFAQLFVESYLQPGLDLALAQMQTNVLEDQEITIQGGDGQPISVKVTADEIRNGRFKAVVTLTNQDASSIAKAQSIERVLTRGSNYLPKIQQEGYDVVYHELFRRWVDLLKIDGSDRTVVKLPPQMMQPPGPSQPGQPETQQAGQPPQYVTDGGPAGQEPTDMNAIAQMLQMQGAQMGPQPNM